MTRAARAGRLDGGRGLGRPPALLLALLLVVGAMLSAASLVALAADADDAPAEASPEERLATLEQRVDGLDQGAAARADRLGALQQQVDQGVKTLNEQMASNRDGIAQLSERLETELKRLDPMALRLDSLAQQQDQLQDLVEEHETRIEDNAVKLYETLMSIDDAAQAMTAVRAELQRVERRAPAPSAAARTAEDAAEADPAATAEGANGDAQGPLTAFALTLLLPVGILLYAAARAPATEAEGAGMPAAPLLLALVGAALGFLLIGIGLRDGASAGGLAGAPFAFLPALFRLAPDAGLPDISGTLLGALPLLAAMALLMAVSAAGRVSATGGLLAGLVLGGLLLPLFGHWSAVPVGGDAQAGGWLARLGFADTEGVVAVALVGGSAALGLALGLRQTPQGTPSPEGTEPPLLAVALLLIWIGWLAPRLVVGDTDAATALVLLSWAAAIGATLGAALFGVVFRRRRARLRGLPTALLAGVVAAPALGVEAGLLVALLFGALVGLLHALATPPLVRRWPAVELALGFVMAGFGAALAPALMGPEGLLFLPVAAQLPVQLLGLAVALALGLGGGLLLGLGLRALQGRPSPRSGEHARPRPGAAAAA